MDAGALRQRIQDTVNPNADVRLQAELDLRYAESNPGFLGALLDILEREEDPQIRLSSVVYLKNRIIRGWPPRENPGNVKLIVEEEKEHVRNRILPILASSTPPVRQQLVPTLNKILDSDFPVQWPNFLDITLALLNAGDANSVLSGLLCTFVLCRVYRFRYGDTRADVDKVTAATFPTLLNIANRLLEENTNECAEMLRVITKTYKHAIYLQLPPHLLAQDQMVGWCTFFIRLIGKEVPPEALNEDFDEREIHPAWKAKKWAYANLNRLFVRYGNPSTLGKNTGDKYTEFSQHFINNFAPQILQSYLAEIEKWVAKTAWLSRPCLSFILAYLDECVKPKSTWVHLKPHIETLISHVLFPVLCITDEEIELFENEPAEYLHRKLNYYEEVTAPDVAALNFLITLTKCRKKETFTVLNYVNEVVSRYEAAPDDQKNPKEKEGALRMVGSLSSIMLGKQSPIADQVEYFFVRYVFPEFRSPHGYLRARACDTLDKFSELDFKDQNNLVIIYRSILECMADPALPVRVVAALALQPLIRHDFIRVSMQQNIPQVMQQLLKLANEIDVDNLANVMEEFVEVFAAELTPFAVALTEQLRDTYLRLVREVIDKNNEEGEDDDGELLDDKSITALGVLQTIGTLMLTLESTPEVLLHLETIIMPVIKITLENGLYDLFSEIFEIIDSCTFSAKMVSPTMWEAFELLHKTFKGGAQLYLEDMLPAIDNFISFGHEMLIRTPIYVEALYDFVFTIFRDDRVGGVDRICGCKIAETMMLHLRGHIDSYVPRFVELAMIYLGNNEMKVKSYRVHLMEMVINTIYYNPLMALEVLEQKGWTNKFFSIWFSSIDSFTRVHDKKLCIAAINSLLAMRAESIPPSVQQGWPRLLQGTVRLFQTLPAAVKNREEATRDEYGVGEGFDDEDTGGDAWADQVAWGNENEEGDEDVADENSQYLQFLHEETQKYGGSADDDDYEGELEEDTVIETPLVKYEPYTMFKNSLLALQQQQPQLYETLTKNLTHDEQVMVQNVIHQAMAIESAAISQANQSLASPGHPPYQQEAQQPQQTVQQQVNAALGMQSVPIHSPVHQQQPVIQSPGVQTTESLAALHSPGLQSIPPGAVQTPPLQAIPASVNSPPPAPALHGNDAVPQPPMPHLQTHSRHASEVHILDGSQQQPSQQQ